MNLFNVLKLNTSFILKNNCDIKITYEEANENNLIVALGDNQLFNFIRRLTNNTDIFDKIKETKDKIKIITKENTTNNNLHKINKLNHELINLKFIPDIISIKADTTKKIINIYVKIILL